MLPKDINSYGGPYVDAEAVEDPETEQSADLGNRGFEDTAQMTRTSRKAYLKFATTLVNGAVVVNADSHTQWGSSSFYFPTLARTGAGRYTATYAATYDDALVGGPSDAISETETVDLRWGDGCVQGLTLGHVQFSFTGPVVDIIVFNAAGAMDDLGGAAIVECKFR